MRRAKRTRKGTYRVPFPLTEILQRRGLTQYRCAQMSGLSQQAVSNLCTGRKYPSWPTLLHLLTSIGADLGDLAPRGVAS